MKEPTDPNYEFAEDVMTSLYDILMNPNLGMDLIETKKDYAIKNATTIIKCMAETADMWFFAKSTPRTILYAVFINTVHEYIMDNKNKHQDRVFWLHLWDNFSLTKTKINELVKKIKNGDKINIDEYHEIFRKDLDVDAQ